VREILSVTDRSYLIKAGQVICHGTPQEIVNNPVAIREYLGSSFTHDQFGQPTLPMIPAAGGPLPRSEARESIHAVVEQEKMRSLIDQLRQGDANAAAELRARGQAVIPVLLEAMERNDVEVRRVAFELYRQLVPGAVEFDPYAPSVLRRQQLAHLRERFERKAG
jgi:lipopolysaccharide export system ATP-binding protein